MLVLVVLAVACTLAAGAGPEPPKCCQDRQWSGVIEGIGGTVYPLTGAALAIDSTTLIAYDYYRKRVGMEVHLRHPNNATEEIIRTLQDFSTDTQYIYQNNQCTVAKIGQPIQEPCVPANATFLGTAMLGYGAQSLKVNTWEFVQPGTDIVVKRSYTAQNCVPVMEAMYGTLNNVPIDLIQFVTGFQPGIDDPANLDLPDTTTCNFVNAIGPIYGRR